jgi:hypothetical protein
MKSTIPAQYALSAAFPSRGRGASDSGGARAVDYVGPLLVLIQFEITGQNGKHSKSFGYHLMSRFVKGFDKKR